MAYNIYFSVHRNPVKDNQGNDTYQVRHETLGTTHKEQLLADLGRRGMMRPELLDMALQVLEREIVDCLTGNHRLHIDGLGTFFLRLGLCPRLDAEGNEQRAVFTDPRQITGRDVRIEGIGFTADKRFLDRLEERSHHFVNSTGHGVVGHSAAYTEQELTERLDQWFSQYDHLTARELRLAFGLTKYMAQKWLDHLCTRPSPYLVCTKIGQLLVYRRR